MKRDPLPAHVLATRIIPNVAPDMAKELGLTPDQKSLAIVTADSDDVTYTALDEATKKADCKVVYAKSFYAGAANANTKLAGEIIGILAAPNPAEAKAGLEACVDMIENVCHFVSANDDDSICYYAHCISRTGSYLSEGCGIAEGDMVRLYNDRGSVVMKATITAGNPAGTLSAVKGWQADEFVEGHFASLPMKDFNQVCANQAFNDVAVAIEKA